MAFPMDQNHDDDQRKAGDAAVENDVGWSPSDSSNSIRDSPCSVDESPSVSPQAGNNDNDEKEMRKSNVSDLVAKSKKAAASLWTLLHAKNCRMGVNRCSHPGCPEAKLMYLHLKTCSSGDLEPCPTGHKGCQDARKLLAHYRRCRDIRARQAHLPPSARSQQHVCLVCSLVARHAKFTLDRTASSCRSANSSKTGTSSHFIPSLNLNHDSNNGHRADGHSSSLMSKSLDGSKCFLSPRSPFASDPAQPRFAFSRAAGNVGISGENSGFQALQAAVSCALGAGPLSSSEDVLDPIQENPSRTVKVGVATGRGYNTRPRSESLDVFRTPSTVPRTTRQLQQGRQHRHQEKNMSYLYLAAVDSFAEDVNTSQVRRRSLSCSVPSSSSPPTDECDAILQKPIGEELQYILGADSS